ncbi:MAG: hypothetical protein HY741_11310 [Chloroflexi bacterium]|nr:hypothetical protein [Chloroflexota bacterium]
MYEVKAKIPSGTEVRDEILDELVGLFEAHGQDCTCGIVQEHVLGYVDEDMLSAVTALLLKFVSAVEVTLAAEDEELQFA